MSQDHDRHGYGHSDTSNRSLGAAVTVLGSKTDFPTQPKFRSHCARSQACSMTQTGGRRWTGELYVRGGNSDANKVLIDGVPANDIGGSD